MALTTEDGTGLANADSYCTQGFADTWHAARGITAWATLLVAEKEQAIVRATGYMQQVYRYRWAGWRNTTTQALDWPRSYVPRIDAPSGYGSFPAYYPDNAVPIEVQQACAELALKAAAGDLAPDIAPQTKREKVDVIEVEYADGAAPWVRFRSIDNMLAGLMKPEAMGSMIRLVRS